MDYLIVNRGYIQFKKSTEVCEETRKTAGQTHRYCRFTGFIKNDFRVLYFFLSQSCMYVLNV